MRIGRNINSICLLALSLCGCATGPHKSSLKATAASPKGQPMEQVTGIGGVFFKVQDPKKLAAWYREHLGVRTEHGYADFIWRDKDNPETKGRTVWSLFPTNTDYFSSPVMINYRVANLDRMLEQLRRGGITIEKTEDYDYGRFAWIKDPEGNRVELWEPKGE
ncbi:MAG: Glyoxalase/Bleomycin resistance protein/Dioxygenase family protein [Pedosphaera sp.]|nr:Glyoxalase/Bleomycin resistance protein/Dioxygenase family protein [Pedosphaera sp.]